VAATVVPLSEASGASVRDARMVVVAGGFSFADALGSGRLFALELSARLGDALHEVVAAGRPVLGICNGFQTLVRTGLLPGSLGHNQPSDDRGAGFTCRWVHLAPEASTACIWTKGLSLLSCPVAHGEGRYCPTDDSRVVLRYAHADGSLAAGSFPANPNGAPADVAGVTDATGVVLGLMPHPENHVLPRQHPSWRRGDATGSCLGLFANGAAYAKEL
jgi:phosphoribosylformylglycinamidine synthase subunit PurQ / glutaminase